MYRGVLTMTHPNQPEAVGNYLATISRCLKYVEDRIVEKTGSVPAHWSELLQFPEHILEYFRL